MVDVPEPVRKVVYRTENGENQRCLAEGWALYLLSEALNSRLL